MSVGQLAAKLQAVKVEGLKKNCQLAKVKPLVCDLGSSPRRLDYPQSLMDHNFAALRSTEICSTSFEISKPALLTYSLTKRLTAFKR